VSLPASEFNISGNVGRVVRVIGSEPVDPVDVSDDDVTGGSSSTRIRGLQPKSRYKFTCADWSNEQSDDVVIEYVHGVLDTRRLLFKRNVVESISDECANNPKSSLFDAVESVACSVVHCR
jgi:hypothetical protein